jgi:ABC-type multidrug transport system fused ATPase/permease subunit
MGVSSKRAIFSAWQQSAIASWQESDWCPLLALARGRCATHFTLSLALAAISGLIDPVIARVLGLLFEQFTQYSSGQLSSTEFASKVPEYLSGLIALGCLSFVLNGSFYASWVGFGERRVESARKEIFRGMLRYPIDWFERQDSGMSFLSSRIQRYVVLGIWKSH